MQTVDDAIRVIRSTIQDRREPYRYEEQEVVDAFNLGLQELRRLRPDAFAGTFVASTTPQFYPSDEMSPPAGYLPTTDVLPVDEMFMSPLISYVAGYVELRDDEFTNDSRAALLLQRFTGQLIGNRI